MEEDNPDIADISAEQNDTVPDISSPQLSLGSRASRQSEPRVVSSPPTLIASVIKQPSILSNNNPSIRSGKNAHSLSIGSKGSRQSQPRPDSPPPIVAPEPTWQNTSPKNASVKYSDDALMMNMAQSPGINLSPHRKVSEASQPGLYSPNNTNVRTGSNDGTEETIAKLQPQGKRISDHIDQLSETVRRLSDDMRNSNSPKGVQIDSSIDKISNMSKVLTSEANALKESIKHLSEDICRTKEGLLAGVENVDFPYHLFLLELIINRIQMKCECFEMDYNNLVISAKFLGKHPIILYDSSCGSIENFTKLNVGKSTLFAMTYDKISSLKEFEIVLEMTKQPPCSHCVTKIAETRMDYTKEFFTLREDLCKKWSQEQPKDNIICTTSTPLYKNQFYLSCGESDNLEAIGMIEVSVRLSFLGKEITTAFSSSPKPKGTSYLLKEGNGITMYSCQKVEMDEQGKILLDEDILAKKEEPYTRRNKVPRSESPISQASRQFLPCGFNNSVKKYSEGSMPRYDEIFTRMNDNELKIRVPKSTRVERNGKYERIQELCECESSAYNTGDQIQFELPRDQRSTDNTYSSHLKYSINAPTKIENKDRKLINITPTNCPVPVNMEKVLHPQKDVFILKIGKKMETKDKKTDLEIELVTPKAPAPVPVANNNIAQQCSTNELHKQEAKKKLKGKGKSKTNLSKKKSKTKAGKSKKKTKK